MVKIAPSTDPAKSLEDLLVYIKQIEHLAYFLHVDIMNSNFVQKTNYDHVFVKDINDNTALMLDVHLMVERPEVVKYIEAGANIVTVHYEAFKSNRELIKTLKLIRKNKTLVGLSVKPNTNLSDIFPYLELCDIILVMSVEPGSSGQKFLEQTYDRVKTLKAEIGNRNIQIEVDGGITPEIASNLSKCGADILVSGSYVYSSDNKAEAIEALIKS